MKTHSDASHRTSRPVQPLPRRAGPVVNEDPDAPLVRWKTAKQLINELVYLADTDPAYSARHPLIQTPMASEFQRRVLNDEDAAGQGNAAHRGNSKIALYIVDLILRECPEASDGEYEMARDALKSNVFFHAILRRKHLCSHEYDKRAADALKIIFHHLAVVDPCAAEALAYDLFKPAIVHIMKPRSWLQRDERPALARRTDNAEERPAKRARALE
ncbi:hypothetical protein HMN09_01064700 [Mycena chlorophos]|uniref:Uncharacterized protein n=1 Tax=Mycena chlorophos TaxID=658473 RepID=A0A8H6W249_MYCCL|nr:hypothetical protein HMN09_01064700 [Mycena chlorophos]